MDKTNCKKLVHELANHMTALVLGLQLLELDDKELVHTSLKVSELIKALEEEIRRLP